MMDFSQVLGNNLKFRYAVMWRGRPYLMSFLSDNQRAWYERWMKQEELNSIVASEIFTDAQREQRLQSFNREVAMGAWRFGGARYKEYYNTPRGRVAWVRMMLVEHHPDITESDVETMLREIEPMVMAVLSLVLTESTLELTKDRTTASQREQALEQVYGTLMKPPEAGGLGLTLDEIRSLTDIQKMELLIKPNQPVESKPEPEEYTNVEKAVIDARLRELAGVAV